jgi:hypothetical protein
LAFNSAKSRMDLSQSKMPPEQPNRLLDLFDTFCHFSAHNDLNSKNVTAQ